MGHSGDGSKCVDKTFPLASSGGWDNSNNGLEGGDETFPLDDFDRDFDWAGLWVRGMITTTASTTVMKRIPLGLKVKVCSGILWMKLQTAPEDCKMGWVISCFCFVAVVYLFVLFCEAFPLGLIVRVPLEG